MSTKSTLKNLASVISPKSKKQYVSVSVTEDDEGNRTTFLTVWDRKSEGGDRIGSISVPTYFAKQLAKNVLKALAEAEEESGGSFEYASDSKS